MVEDSCGVGTVHEVSSTILCELALSPPSTPLHVLRFGLSATLLRNLALFSKRTAKWPKKQLPPYPHSFYASRGVFPCPSAWVDDREDAGMHHWGRTRLEDLQPSSVARVPLLASSAALLPPLSWQKPRSPRDQVPYAVRTAWSFHEARKCH